jgi:hypothetical protein
LSSTTRLSAKSDESAKCDLAIDGWKGSCLEYHSRHRFSYGGRQLPSKSHDNSHRGLLKSRCGTMEIRERDWHTSCTQFQALVGGGKTLLPALSSLRDLSGDRYVD